MNTQERYMLWGWENAISPTTLIESLSPKALCDLFEMEQEVIDNILPQLKGLRLGELYLRRCIDCKMIIWIHRKPSWIKRQLPHRCDHCAFIQVEQGRSKNEAYYD